MSGFTVLTLDPLLSPGSRPGTGGLRRWIAEYLRDPAGALAGLADRLDGLARTVGPAAPALLIGLAVLAGARWWWRRRCRERLVADARLITVLAPPAVDPVGGEVLWSNLVGLLRPAWARWLTGQPHLVWECVFSPSGVGIQVWVPGPVPPGLVERAVQAAWPGAHTHTQRAWPPVPVPEAGGRRIVVAGELRLARPEPLPIRTAFDTDPLRALLGAPAGLGAGEHACVQILARPVTGRRVARARLAARRLHAGAAPHWAGHLLDLLTPGPVSRSPRRVEATQDPQAALEHSAANRAIVGKARGAQYETLLRYAVTALVPPGAGPVELRRARDQARGRAHAIASAFATYTEHNHYTRHRLRHPARVLAERQLGRGDLLSVPELAGLAHLPTDEATPGLRRAGARAVAPSPGIPAPGAAVKPLGVTDTGHPHPVGLRVTDARHHLHVLGATGSGKSTLLAHMILADAVAGRGVVVIDPKGDLVTDVLARLPQEAGQRVVVFDADSRRRPPCLNPLHGGDPDLTVDNLISVFRRVFAAFWGPRTDDVMRAACLTLRTQPGVASLADLPRLLAEPAFRARVTAAVTDPVLAGFWTWYDQLSDPARAEVTAPLMNKLRTFLLRPFVRAALTAGPSTVDLTQVLDGGICLVRIPKGSLGEDTTRLVGSLVMARAWQATTARAATPQHQRPDAAIVVDECHNFLNLPYPLEDMLAEARGFRVAMTLAHQHLGQLPRELREGVSTNARSKVFFTASPDDARDLARHTTPQLTDHDLAHLGAYHAAARLVLHGEHTPAFTLRTTPLPAPIPGRARQIRAAAHHALRTRQHAPHPAPGRATSSRAPGRPPRTPATSTPPPRPDPARRPAPPRPTDPRRHR